MKQCWFEWLFKQGKIVKNLQVGISECGRSMYWWGGCIDRVFLLECVWAFRWDKQSGHNIEVTVLTKAICVVSLKENCILPSTSNWKHEYKHRQMQLQTQGPILAMHECLYCMWKPSLEICQVVCFVFKGWRWRGSFEHRQY